MDNAIERWTKTIDNGGYLNGNDVAMSVAIDSTGAVYGAGYLDSTTDGWLQSGYLVKYDVTGTSAWDLLREPGASAGNERNSGVAVDSGDNVVYAGSTDSQSYPHTAFVVESRDWEGNLNWNGNQNDGPWSPAYDVAVVGTDVYAAGRGFGAWGSQEMQWYIIAYDGSGTLHSGFPLTYNNSINPVGSDVTWGVASDGDGNVIGVGQIGLSSSNLDWHVRKYNSSGTFQWSDTFSGATNVHDVAAKVAVDSNDDFLVVGYTNKGTDNGDNLDYDWRLAKYAADVDGDSNPVILWEKAYESAAERSETVGAVVVDDVDNFYVGGNVRDGDGNQQARLIYVDGSDGTVLSEKIWSDGATSVHRVDVRGALLALALGYDNGTDTDFQIALYELDEDADGVGDDGDLCLDTPDCATNIDGDGCAIDTDSDLSPDGCDNCPSDANEDQANNDLDSLGDVCDDDDDNDLVVDTDDSHPFDETQCQDLDADGCEDCVGGTADPAADGDDTDSDGICDVGDNCVDVANADQANNDLDASGDVCDGDDDNDLVLDGDDSHPLDEDQCQDLDADGCDDCAVGTADPTNDGTDTDSDGTCDGSDTDDDGDGVLDADDSAPLDATACRDVDADTCDDCSSSTDDPSADGPDEDSDGICDSSDACTGTAASAQVDGDGCSDAQLEDDDEADGECGCATSGGAGHAMWVLALMAACLRCRDRRRV
ncbi:MAG: hypothetical protein JRI25_11250 [Deltaproteobacteria bacterium]|nr:hypothetical protein [Deltaproteobacteria bacterium]MBW2255161.1 hypothetical protein [Deltaproteobacteria bacterium]